MRDEKARRCDAEHLLCTPVAVDDLRLSGRRLAALEFRKLAGESRRELEGEMGTTDPIR